MAGVSTKEIKNRIRSMESTKQITKAMEMVASSKLRHAQDRVTAARPYFQILHDTIADILRSNEDFSSPYLEQRQVKKIAFVVIAGDRGLAGGYNANVLKLAQEQMEGRSVVVLPIGKKAVDHFKSRGVSILTENYSEAAEVSVGDCFSMAKQLCKGYLQGDYDEVCVCYTGFDSVLSQTPAVMHLLPLVPDESDGVRSDVLYEPDSTEVFRQIVPEYLGGILYGSLCESCCSELAARRTAMDAATQNAEDMIADLSLKFNQARQAAITNEIIDIVAGS